MIGKFLEGLDPSEFLNALQNQAEQSFQGDFYKPLSIEEIAERKECYTANAIRIGDLEAKKKEQDEFYKGQIKPIAQSNSILLDEIKTRQSKQTGVLYEVANYDDSVWETYSDEGTFINSRPMRPDERRQPNIFSLPKAK